MKEQRLIATLLRSARILALAGLICWQAAANAANERVKLDGTWQLAKARSTLAMAGAEALPFTAEGRKQYEQNKALAAKADYSFDLTMMRCSAPGLPRLMLTPDRFRVFQRPEIVAMMFEWNRQLRQIDLREAPQERPDVDSANGLSFGKWEGDTLVVKSFGFTPGKLLDNYLPSSESLELVERIRLKDKNTLEDRITITDPNNFTQPWEAVLTYKRRADETFPEDVCLDRKSAGQPPLPRTHE